MITGGIRIQSYIITYNVNVIADASRAYYIPFEILSVPIAFSFTSWIMMVVVTVISAVVIMKLAVVVVILVGVITLTLPMIMSVAVVMMEVVLV